jgi:hypothetical protein
MEKKIMTEAAAWKVAEKRFFGENRSEMDQFSFKEEQGDDVFGIYIAENDDGHRIMHSVFIGTYIDEDRVQDETRDYVLAPDTLYDYTERI